MVPLSDEKRKCLHRIRELLSPLHFLHQHRRYHVESRSRILLHRYHHSPHDYGMPISSLFSPFPSRIEPFTERRSLLPNRLPVLQSEQPLPTLLFPPQKRRIRLQSNSPVYSCPASVQPLHYLRMSSRGVPQHQLPHPQGCTCLSLTGQGAPAKSLPGQAQLLPERPATLQGRDARQSCYRRQC